MIGEVVGGYRVTAKLGEGGMGVVFLAEHTVMGRKAAVKFLHASLSSNGEMVQRFFNEARAAGAISHPGIVSVFDVGIRDDGAAFIVMDYLEGESLAERLHRRGRLSGDEALAITRQILSALSAAHAMGIVHRDLKPDNIFLVPDADVPGGERIKLLDFGIAKLQSDSGPDMVTTRAGALMGTPVYMSPEQCRGAGECDQRTDLYAVGVMLFELLTGRPPFTGTALGELMASHMRDAPPTLSEKLGPTSIELEALVATLLAKAPEDRFPSGEMAIAKIDSASFGVLSSGIRSPTQVPPASGQDSFDPMAQTAVGTLPVHNTRGTTLRNTAGSVDVSQVRQPAPRRIGRWAMPVLLVASVALTAYFALRETPREQPLVTAQVERVPVVLEDASPVAPLPERQRKPTPRADALPKLNLAAVPDDDLQTAKRLHKRALKLHRAESFEEAYSAYASAIEADPGHILARYNYACLLAVAGETHEGLAILAQLKEAGCPVCLGRLIRARSDTEWESAWNSSEFQAITGDVRVLQPSPNETGFLAADAMRSGTLTLLQNLFSPRGRVSMKYRPSGCKARSCEEKTIIIGFEGFSEWMSEKPTIQASGSQRCARECCSYKPGAQPGLQLRRICTAVDSGSVRTISALEFSAVEPPSTP
tara:strand:- start:39610 stop:41559 length:1950 start_codon:yes stop_codon:yes gene_type:complete